MKVHKSITIDVLLAAVERRITTLDNPGFCVQCGAESDSCEPDARNYQCDECGANAVFGAEELLLYNV